MNTHETSEVVKKLRKTMATVSALVDEVTNPDRLAIRYDPEQDAWVTELGSNADESDAHVLVKALQKAGILNNGINKRGLGVVARELDLRGYDINSVNIEIRKKRN